MQLGYLALHSCRRRGNDYGTRLRGRIWQRGRIDLDVTDYVNSLLGKLLHDHKQQHYFDQHHNDEHYNDIDDARAVPVTRL
jgi:hypothetical protein